MAYCHQRTGALGSNYKRVKARTIMRITEGGRITIPKKLRVRLGLGEGVEVDMVPTDEGLLIRKCASESAKAEDRGELDPSIIGAWKRNGGIMGGLYSNTDDFINDIRGPVDHGN